ncbi:MAG: RNA polymerase sigma factor [Planctomycetota bacterium]|jgi:RNA polymerase sigma-70 factor (ECF subfamily)
MTTVAWPGEFDDELPLIQAIQDGDRYAFAEFVRRHDRWVRSVIFGVLGGSDRVDDVAQQAWTALWSRAKELRNVGKWRSWLYRLVRNAAIDAGRDITRRRDRRQESLEHAASGGWAVMDPNRPETDLVRDERRDEVMAAVASLPALYREPFVLRHVNGWSYREIAEVMNMPVDSIETRLVRARRFLREALQRRLDGEAG